jgi:hypothetical protein
MTQPDHDAYPPAQSPWTPPTAPAGTGTMPAPESGAAAPAAKKGLAKFLPVAGSVAVAGVLGVGQLTGWFGAAAGAPEVGDCVQLTGDNSYEVVDCGGDTAEYTIVGIEAEQQTYAEFLVDTASCAGFAATEYVLWSGESETEPGDVYCAAPA